MVARLAPRDEDNSQRELFHQGEYSVGIPRFYFCICRNFSSTLGVMRSMNFLRFALIFFASAHLLLAETSQPNVIVILADDMGWGDLSCFGQKKYKTPNLDRMAKEGALLTDFYAPCPYCAPTRASLLTGRYQFRSGMTQNPSPDGNKASDLIGLDQNEITLANVFKKKGYYTAAIGKWHLGHQPEFNPTKRGFDEYLGILYSHDMRPVQVVDGMKVVEYPVVLANLMKKYVKRAELVIEKNKSKPFFLYFASPLPHKPLFASEENYKQSGGGLYGDAMLELDWSVGEIFKKLKELNLDEKTLVFFASDNGPWYGGSTGGLRGMKGNTWEGGVRVPFMARWPGKIPAGHASHEPAIMMDIFSTALAACEIQPPQDRTIDGKNIMPLLTGDAKSPHDAIFSMGQETLFTVRSGKWKLHLYPPGRHLKVMKPDEPWTDKRGPDGVTILAPFEQPHPSNYPGLLEGDETKAGSLYDLEKDPAEQHDVAAEHPDVVKKLKAQWEEMNKQATEALERRSAGKK